MSEIQGFGRWGQPQPVQEFGGRIPQALQFGGRIPFVEPESGRGWPQATRQEFGRGFPTIDQGWRSPREVPPSARSFLH